MWRVVSLLLSLSAVGQMRLVGVMLMMRNRGGVGCWSWSCVCLLVSYLSRAVLYHVCKCISGSN